VTFEILYTTEAEENLSALQRDKPKKAKKVKRALGYLEQNPRHPSLQTHEITSLSAIYKVQVWEAYAENNTPAAYRIFWYYGPASGQITVLAITQHP
jgi:mRNA-degrading endonuclease RelE of RelBE toxin-antitoxin system